MICFFIDVLLEQQVVDTGAIQANPADEGLINCGSTLPQS
jgi:hypothetical protein